MKRFDVKTMDDLMKVAAAIVDASAKDNTTELWHPDLVWGAPLTTFTEAEWDDVAAHAPRRLSVRITTPHKMVVVKDIWWSPEIRDFGADDIANVRLELLVAAALRRMVDKGPAVVDINIDWDTAVPVDVDGMIPRRRRRR